MPEEANVILYHCNDKNRCMKFLSSDTYMIISEEDGKWLGKGMYFWDNLGNAKYWKGEKQRKKPNGNFVILKARVSIENLLDLTDTEICVMLEKLWNAYKIKIGADTDDRTVDLGRKLNLLYKCVPEFKDFYKVIKIYGKYNRTPNNGFFHYNISDSRIEPTLAVKSIYNVKCKEAIIDRLIHQEVIDNG